MSLLSTWYYFIMSYYQIKLKSRYNIMISDNGKLIKFTFLWPEYINIVFLEKKSTIIIIL